MNTQRKLYSILSGFLLIAVLLLTGACTTEETENTIPVFNPDDPIMIYATVDGTSIATRAGENEKIKSRTMLFTYPSLSAGKIQSAICEFDEKGYGYVYTNNSKTEKLRWKDINITGKDTIYLDNLVNYPVQDPTLTTIHKKNNEIEVWIDNFTYFYFGPEDPNMKYE